VRKNHTPVDSRVTLRDAKLDKIETLLFMLPSAPFGRVKNAIFLLCVRRCGSRLSLHPKLNDDVLDTHLTPP